MSKNLTRKGLALGAVVALGASLLNAVPAQAAGELTIQPSVGSIWAVPSTETFDIKANFTAGYSSSEAAKLKFKLDTNGGFALYADGDTAAQSATPAASVALGETSAVEPTAGGATTYLSLKVNSASASTTYTANVTAWVDADSDDVIDSGEWTSATQTVTFLKAADINWTLDLVDPVRAATTAELDVTSTNINLAQLDTYTSSDADTKLIAVFYSGAAGTTLAYAAGTAATTSATYAVADGDSAGVALAYDSTDGRLEATSPSFTGASVADIWKANLYWESTAATANANSSANDPLDLAVGDSDGLLTGTANDTAVATRTETVPAAIVTAVGAIANVKSTSVTAVDTATASIAPDATSLKVTSEVTFATGKTSAEVTFTVSEDAATSSGLNTIDAGASLSAGGKTLKNANAGLKETIDVVVKTDADGVATLALTTAGLKDGNKFTIKAASQGYNNTVTYTVANRVATGLKNTNAIGTNADSAVLVFAKDAAFDLKYAVLDQYGALLSVAGHSVTVSDGTNSWSASVSNGYATVSVPAYDATTTKTMTPTVYKNGVDVTITEPTASIKIATATAAASVTASGATGYDADHKEDLNLKAPAAADTRVGATAPSVTASTGVTITGTVKDSSLNTTTSSVTLSAAGLLFEADGVWAIGSITVNTDADGGYSVDAYSNKAGKKVVTVTAGAATVTEELFFADAADDAGETLSVVVPSVVKAGNALVVKGTLVDAFGNPVTADGTDEDFNITYTGPGFAGTIPTSVNADGSFRFYVLLGNNDSGVATIEVAYDLDEDGDYTDTGDILVSKTVLVGMSAKITKAKTSTVVVKNAMGETVKVVRGTKSKTVTATSNSQKVTLKGGSGSVKVYVNGVKLASK